MPRLLCRHQIAAILQPKMVAMLFLLFRWPLYQVLSLPAHPLWGESRLLVLCLWWRVFCGSLALCPFQVYLWLRLVRK